MKNYETRKISILGRPRNTINRLLLARNMGSLICHTSKSALNCKYVTPAMINFLISGVKKQNTDTFRIFYSFIWFIFWKALTIQYWESRRLVLVSVDENKNPISKHSILINGWSELELKSNEIIQKPNSFFLKWISTKR